MIKTFSIAGYAGIKALAKQQRCNIPDLLVLSRNNDPFYMGSPAQVEDAQWFADLYHRLGFGAGAHLRRIHYRIVSQAVPIHRPNGRAYQNTDEDWNFLCVASKAARILRLVEVTDFEDHRNPDPILLRSKPAHCEPGLHIDPPDLSLPRLSAELPAPNLTIPEAEVYGYVSDPADQPFLLEIWVEKSTMNDVLLPICKRYGANLVTSVGFQSMVAAVNLARRAMETQRPARVLYLADFDPAGDRMPIAVARQLEYWTRTYPDEFGGVDIALTPLALAQEQVIRYHLPRIPIKESDRRRAGFEDRYGEGAVELDALEALYPGELARIVSQAIQNYWDPDLADHQDEQAQAVQDEISGLWEEETEPEHAELETLITDAGDVYEQYRDELADLAARLDADLAPFQERASDLESRLRDKRAAFDPDLPDRLQSELEPPDESAWLFKSDRDYFTQLRAYRREVEA